MPRLLAEKIIILKNDTSARKKQKFVLVKIKTNITGIIGKDKTGSFSPSEKQSLQQALHQSIIFSSLETGSY